MGFEHPYAERLRTMGATLFEHGVNQNRFCERLEMLLAIYAQHGEFTRQNLGPELWLWLGSTRRAYYSHEISVKAGYMLELLGLLKLTRPYVRKTGEPLLTMDERMDRAAKAAARMVRKEEARQRLLAIKPEAFKTCPHEDPAMTIWWWYLWEWRRHVTERRNAMPDELQVFKEVTGQFAALDLLDARQLALVELLAIPYQPVMLGETRKSQKLRLVARQA